MIMIEKDTVNPLVSIVTVTYNSVQYVRDTIESVLAQTYTNIEYIIGDDFSTDNTWDIICEYKDPRIKAYRNDVNLKEYPNRNKALEMATGKYLIFIDGDDVIYPHGIAYYVSQLELFPSSAMAIQKNYINSILFPANLYPEETLKNHFFGKIDLLSSSFASNFFRTEIIQELRLRTHLKSGDDEIRLRIAAKYPVLFIQGWVSWPRETPGQASSKIDTGKNLIDSTKYSLEVVENVRVEKELKEEIIYKVRRNMAKYFFGKIVRGEFIQAAKFFAASKYSLLSLFEALSFSPKTRDFLADYSPSLPFKRDFLKKSNEQNSR
jgi:glycosyltransferase involved in cell wall biosynthesis